MEEILPKYLRREIGILFYILGKRETSTKEIANFFGISTRLAKHSVLDINNHFREKFEKNNFVVSNNFGVVTVNPIYGDSALNDINLMKLELLKGNTLFNLCILLITKPQISRKQIIQTLYISNIYLDKLVYKLRLYLKKFFIRIDINSGYYKLAGNEINIRVFSYIILTQTFKNIEWPFDAISLEKVMKSVRIEDFSELENKTITQKYSIYYLYAIFYTRVEGKNFLNNYHTKDEEEILTGIFEKLDVSQYQYGDTSSIFSNPEVPDSEIKHFLFLVLISGPDMLSEEGKNLLGDYFYNLKHSYSMMAREVVEANGGFGELTNRQGDVKRAVYILTLSIISSYMIQGGVRDFIRLLASDHLQYLDMEEENIDKFWVEHPLAEMQEEQEFVIKRLLYSSYFVKEAPQLRIFLEMTKDLSATQHIKLRLEKLFNTENIYIVNEITEADIIVADTFEEVENNHKVFYLDSINNQSAWDELQLHILKCYLQMRHEIEGVNNL